MFTPLFHGTSIDRVLMMMLAGQVNNNHGAPYFSTSRSANTSTFFAKQTGWRHGGALLVFDRDLVRRRHKIVPVCEWDTDAEIIDEEVVTISYPLNEHEEGICGPLTRFEDYLVSINLDIAILEHYRWEIYHNNVFRFDMQKADFDLLADRLLGHPKLNIWKPRGARLETYMFDPPWKKAA
jgi:hypothetical protein